MTYPQDPMGGWLLRDIAREILADFVPDNDDNTTPSKDKQLDGQAPPKRSPPNRDDGLTLPQAPAKMPPQ
jgi:hypothetical protein